MWTKKYWNLDGYNDMVKWVKNHKTNYEIIPIFINNGYAVEYRMLKKF